VLMFSFFKALLVFFALFCQIEDAASGAKYDEKLCDIFLYAEVNLIPPGGHNGWKG